MNMGKLALVTGASGTIGSATALALAENNYDLILHYNQDEEGILKVVEKCRVRGIEVTAIKANLADYRAIDSMFNRLADLKLMPNILINAAGLTHYGLIQDVTYDDWQRIINANMMSVFFCSQKVVPLMVKVGYGRIINLSSVWGEKGAANEVLYSMTKGAINSFTKALARELAPSGITVNAIAPGIVLSKMMNGFSNVELEEMKMQIPMKRFAEPEEITETVLHILKPESSYLTGQIITIDGSWT